MTPTINLTINVTTVEAAEAIFRALQELNGPRVTSVPISTPAVPEVPAVPAAPAAPQLPEAAQAAVEAFTEEPSPFETTSAPPAFISDDEIRELANSLIQSGKKAELREIASAMGIQMLTSTPPEQRPELMRRMREVA